MQNRLLATPTPSVSSALMKGNDNSIITGLGLAFAYGL